MHDAGILIPISIFLGGFAMIFGIVYLRTRENMALIEKGKDPRSPRPYRSLKAGLLFLGAGLGLLFAFLIDNSMNSGNNINYHMHDSIVAIYFALIAVGGGLGLVGSYAIERKAMLRGEDTE